MSIAVIRPYEAEDKARVKAAAERFAARHGIGFSPATRYDLAQGGDTAAETAIDYAIYSAHPEDKARLRKLWAACYCRALRVPVDVRTTVGYGHIGVSID